ncbi:MAG: sugar transferase [Acutalibacteraceae bacterium]|nr:sugar transferase [Acutalibacteraceae bacterium]
MLSMNCENIVKEQETATADTFVFKEKPVYAVVKRIIDILISSVFIILLSPLFLVIIILISLDDKKGQPVFSQIRCGKNGKEFKIYKFRTMCVDAEEKLKKLQDENEMDGPVFKIKDDPRITRIGKFLRATSIDEFPQLVNILIGDMSFVGPRPPLPREVAEYSELDRCRLKVVPGLTCYWQIEPERNSISFEKWMELDRKYIQDRNLWLDIKLIFKTFLVVFNREGC